MCITVFRGSFLSFLMGFVFVFIFFFYYVYEDDFVKGFIHIQGTQVLELYVDTFFVDQGIGGKLLDFAVSRNCNSLWVLEKNTKAQHFYLRHGFTPSGVRQLEEGTEQFIIEMIR